MQGERRTAGCGRRRRQRLRDEWHRILRDREADKEHRYASGQHDWSSSDAPREVYVDAALNMQQNTCPFDVSGHPALTVPCAKINGLPVGTMLVGRHFEETTVIQAAQAIERAGVWQTR